MNRRRPPVQNVRFQEIQHRPAKRKPHVVRWTIDGHPVSRSFATKAQAKRYKSRLVVAYDDGELFDTTTGEPASWHPQGEDTPVYDWARQWLAEQWDELAPRTREGYAEALARFVPLVVDARASDPPADITAWTEKALVPAHEVDENDAHERWLRRWGLTLGDLNRSLLAEVDRKLGIGVRGGRLAPATANRFRRYSKSCISRAVELERIPANPWPPPRRGRNRRKANRIDKAVDIRRLPAPQHMMPVLESLPARTRRRSGLIYRAMSAVAYYAGLRPSEVVMLRLVAVLLPHLPAGGWGLMVVEAADDGERNPADPKTGRRVVPIPPVLVWILHEYVRDFPRAPDELLFQTEDGRPVSLPNWLRALGRACQRAGVEKLTLYDLRHACATVWLQSGVPLGEAARRLGHSVQTLVAYYIQALAGDETTANQRIEDALRRTPVKASALAGFTSS